MPPVLMCTDMTRYDNFLYIMPTSALYESIVHTNLSTCSTVLVFSAEKSLANLPGVFYLFF